VGTNHISGTADRLRCCQLRWTVSVVNWWALSRDPFFNFDARNHIFGMAEATVAKLCIQVEYIKCFEFNDGLLHNWRGQGHVTRFFKFCPNHVLVKLGTSNFVCWLIHRSTNACIIYYPQKGCVMCHVTSLNFGKEVIIIISSTVQDRDIVAVEH